MRISLTYDVVLSVPELALLSRRIPRELSLKILESHPFWLIPWPEVFNTKYFCFEIFLQFFNRMVSDWCSHYWFINRAELSAFGKLTVKHTSSDRQTAHAHNNCIPMCGLCRVHINAWTNGCSNTENKMLNRGLRMRIYQEIGCPVLIDNLSLGFGFLCFHKNIVFVTWTTHLNICKFYSKLWLKSITEQNALRWVYVVYGRHYMLERVIYRLVVIYHYWKVCTVINSFVIIPFQIHSFPSIIATARKFERNY